LRKLHIPKGNTKKGNSFRDYLRDNNKLKELDNKSYIKQNKLLKINTKLFATISKEYYHKSGIKTDIEKKRKYQNWRIEKQLS